MPRKVLSSEELLNSALAHYRQRGWTAQEGFSAAEERLFGRLSLRPSAVAKMDGMEHLVFGLGKVTDATFKLLKQLLFDIQHAGELCHVVIVLAEKVSQKDEGRLKDIGVGILVIRSGSDPVSLAAPRLCCFRAPGYDRVRASLRGQVKSVIRRIAEEDVTVGVLDLSQILERELERRLAGKKGKPLGALIRDARKGGIIGDLHQEAAKRVNDPRIKRAHHAGHSVRRKVVRKAQGIVDDCLAMLFVLG